MIPEELHPDIELAELNQARSEWEDLFVEMEQQDRAKEVADLDLEIEVREFIP